ncbi:MAG: GntR family transcriptional regulator [SAR324 cluster bacterium]|nr:GntR family transcriptional regulator [SAR324 cluster bacterium]
MGDKLAGTRLVLFDLEKEMKLGRGPIREALIKLDRTGLIKNIPYKGAIVANPPTRKEISYIFDIRIDLEVKLAIEALSHINEEQINELESLYTQMKNPGPNYYSLDRKFHNTIYDASGLSHLCMVVKKLIQSVETFLILYPQEKNVCLKFNEEHGRILEAVKAKNAEELKTVLAKNIKGGLEIIEKSFQKMMRIPN